MYTIVFEINEDTIYKDKCCGEFHPMFFLVYVKEKNVGPVNFLHEPVDARSYWSYRASIILS